MFILQQGPRPGCGLQLCLVLCINQQVCFYVYQLNVRVHNLFHLHLICLGVYYMVFILGREWGNLIWDISRKWLSLPAHFRCSLVKNDTKKGWALVGELKDIGLQFLTEKSWSVCLCTIDLYAIWFAKMLKQWRHQPKHYWKCKCFIHAVTASLEFADSCQAVR